MRVPCQLLYCRGPRSARGCLTGLSTTTCRACRRLHGVLDRGGGQYRRAYWTFARSWLDWKRQRAPRSPMLWLYTRKMSPAGAELPPKGGLVARGVERPPKAGVAAQSAGIGIVLHEAAQVEVGRDIHQGTDANQGRLEVALAESPDVVLSGELEDEGGRGFPGALQPELVQVAIVEAAERPGELAGQAPPRGELGLELVADEIVGAGRDHHPARHLERRDETLPLGYHVRFDPVSAFQ